MVPALLRLGYQVDMTILSGASSGAPQDRKVSPGFLCSFPLWPGPKAPLYALCA